MEITLTMWLGGTLCSVHTLHNYSTGHVVANFTGSSEWSALFCGKMQLLRLYKPAGTWATTEEEKNASTAKQMWMFLCSHLLLPVSFLLSLLFFNLRPQNQAWVLDSSENSAAHGKPHLRERGRGNNSTSVHRNRTCTGMLEIARSDFTFNGEIKRNFACFRPI